MHKSKYFMNFNKQSAFILINMITFIHMSVYKI